MNAHRIAATLAILAACILAPLTDNASASAPPCMEDRACWSWSTMGNERRGVYVKGHAKVRVVSPCAFAFLDYSGRIDWKRTKRLKGDWHARRHGCDPTMHG